MSFYSKVGLEKWYDVLEVADSKRDNYVVRSIYGAYMYSRQTTRCTCKHVKYEVYVQSCGVYALLTLTLVSELNAQFWHASQWLWSVEIK
jgi:hypothetical protein